MTIRAVQGDCRITIIFQHVPFIAHLQYNVNGFFFFFLQFIRLNRKQIFYNSFLFFGMKKKVQLTHSIRFLTIARLRWAR